jgi:LytR cell envelope-related transcriptional attenuator
VNLGVGRVLVIVALVAAGIVVLAKGFGGTGATVAASASPSATRTRSSPASATSTATPTESPSSTPAPRTKGVLFMVLNGTTVTGLGAAAEEMLTSHDYAAPVPAANAPTQGVKTTTVYYRPGQNEAQNKSDATYVSETYFPGSKVDKLGPAFDTIVPQAATIAIVVGEDFANKQAA